MKVLGAHTRKCEMKSEKASSINYSENVSQADINTHTHTWRGFFSFYTKTSIAVMLWSGILFFRNNNDCPKMNGE
jgi:hypothetical protein